MGAASQPFRVSLAGPRERILHSVPEEETCQVAGGCRIDFETRIGLINLFSRISIRRHFESARVSTRFLTAGYPNRDQLSNPYRILSLV